MDPSKQQTWHILLIDDDEEDFILTRDMLKEAHGRIIKLDWASTYNEGLQAICSLAYDVILVDYDLGLKTGVELIHELVSGGCTTPLVLYTGRGSYEVDEEALVAGATMYLTKAEANPLLLERILRYAIERKQGEEKLAASEENYRLLFSTMLNGFAVHEIVVDEQGKPVDYRFLDINPAFEQLTGLKKADVIGKTVKDVLPGIEQEWIDRYGAVALTGIPVEFENYAAPLNKYYRVYAVSPRPNQFAVLFTDITAHRKALAEVQENEQRYQALAAATFEGILFSENGIILDVNEQLAALFGYTSEEMIGWELGKLAAPEDTRRIMENALAGREGLIEHVGMRKDGSRFLVEARAKMMTLQDRQVRVTAVRDITEQRRMVNALRESEERYSSLFNNHHTPMLLIDPATARIVDANPAACEFYGWSKDQMTAMKITDINTLAPGETFQKMAQAQTASTNQKFTFWHRLASGELRLVDVHSGPIQIGAKTYIFSIIQELSYHP